MNAERARKLDEAFETIGNLLWVIAIAAGIWWLIDHQHKHQMKVCLYEQSYHQASDTCRDFLAEEANK